MCFFVCLVMGYGLGLRIGCEVGYECCLECGVADWVLDSKEWVRTVGVDSF